MELIREQRALLFGAFSSKVSKKQKNEAWEKITTTAKSKGLVPENKDAAYIRDTYWQNLRKRTMRKVDNSRATGTAGGKEAILDDIDNLVIDIIGKYFICIHLYKCKALNFQIH